MKAAIKDKHIRLDQKKIERAKAILKAKTETEAIARALELVISGDLDLHKRKECMKRILVRRDRLKVIEGDVADWIREGREERNRVYGR